MVVSGRRTPTRPLPWEASPFSCDIAEKSLVKDDAEMFDAFPPVVVADDFLLLDDPPQATSPAATTRATATTDTRFNEILILASLDRGHESLSQSPQAFLAVE